MALNISSTSSATKLFRTSESTLTVSEVIFRSIYLLTSSGFGILDVACWALVPKFAGSNPAEAVRFFGRKILSTPSFGGEVKPSVPCRALRNVKELKCDVEVATFGKILRDFSHIVPPSAAGFASVASDSGGLLWRKLERSKSVVLLQVGCLTCRWKRHSLKPSC
jgi:hypothetical protein